MTKTRKKNCGCSMKGGKTSSYPFSSSVAAKATPRSSVVNIDNVPYTVTKDSMGSVSSGSAAMMKYMLDTPMASGGGYSPFDPLEKVFGKIKNKVVGKKKRTKKKTTKKSTKKSTKKTTKKTTKKSTKKTTKKTTKRKIHKGPRGGKYYVSKEKKVYI